MDRNWLSSKTVIVTGASSGIGRGITEKLIKEHSCTVLGIARSENKMQALAADLGEYADKFSYQLFDISMRKNWEKYIAYLNENNIKPDVLINGAGILPKFNRFRYCSIEDIEETMNINFYGAVYSMYELLPLILKSSSPAIINIDSSAAFMPLAGTAAYSASKAALKSFTEAVREELRGKCYVGIVCPGFTMTDIFRSQNFSDEKGQKMLNTVSSPCDKMVRKIMKGIVKKRSLTAFGTDAQCMKYFGKFMPVQGSRIFSNILKKSGLPLFDDVFKDD